MNNISRRQFVKNVGIGMGIAATTPMWLNTLIAQNPDAVGTKMLQTNFGFTKEELNKLLLIALSKGGDFSELYFEYIKNNSVGMEEGLIKSSSEYISLGVGIRVIKDNNYGYAHTSDLTFDKIQDAALSAAAIAMDNNSKVKSINVNESKINHQYYDLSSPVVDIALKEKINLLQTTHDAALNFDSKIQKVNASLTDEMQYITIANSEGLLISDVRPQTRLVVSATAIDGDNRGTGRANIGGRVGYQFYTSKNDVVALGKKAADEALKLLEAKNAPAGEMTVVLDKNQSGVMIHEAVGHPFEADFIWKKTSTIHDKLGETIGSPLVNIYDTGFINDYRGSLNIDDEGYPCEKTMLMEKGKVVGFINDKLSAQALKHARNGHGRRQSYEHIPIPRMANTVLDKGNTPPEEIIESVKNGFYAISYQGGMVEGTGKFTFSVSFGYLIENGKLTTPLKNATLIGTNTIILKEIDMVGNDMAFFLGSCGKSGQSVPVTAGTPTLRIKKMTVGGIIS
ncbi:MAG: TldD/PmbA family protein [Bacteroidetes bacterium]|nr:TldD/PmbA family protein [Bacteroidota bacterium]